MDSETGAPLAGVRVELWWKGGDRSGFTGPDGVWRTPRPLGRTTVRVGAQPESDGTWVRSVSRGVEPEDDLARVETGRTGAVAGRILGPDGAPVVGAVLHLRADGVRQAVNSRTSSDEQGRYVVQFPPGTMVELEVWDRTDKGPFLRASVGPVAATANGVDLNLVEDTADAAVDVLVVDPDGEAVADAEVTASVPIVRRNWIGTYFGDAGGRWSARTDAQGRARLTRLPHYPVGVSASPPPGRRGLISAWGRSRAGSGDEVSITLRPGSRVAGQVVDESGRAVAWAQVQATTKDGSDAGSGQADREGRFSVDIEPKHAGPFRVRAQLNELSAEAAGVAPDTDDLRLVLKRR